MSLFHGFYEAGVFFFNIIGKPASANLTESAYRSVAAPISLEANGGSLDLKINTAFTSQPTSLHNVCVCFSPFILLLCRQCNFWPNHRWLLWLGGRWAWVWGPSGLRCAYAENCSCSTGEFGCLCQANLLIADFSAHLLHLIPFAG